MHDVLRFWLERGVDGFRVDVIWHLIKDEELRDNPTNPDFGSRQPYHEALIPSLHHRPSGGPRHRREHAGLVDRYPDRVLIGEVYLPVERLVRVLRSDLRGAHLPFNFQLVLTTWDARASRG